MRFPQPKLKIEAGFPLTLFLLSMPFWIAGTTTTLIMGAVVAATLGLSILLHEYGHAFAAFRCGIMPKTIVLQWLGGITTLNREPYTRRDRILVTIAGPAVNLGLALLGYALAPLASSWLLGWSLNTLAFINLALGLFNLLPAIPLDGGRVLYQLVGWRWGEAAAMKVVGLLGTVVGALALVVTVVGLWRGFFIFLPIDPRRNWRLYRASRSAPPPQPSAATAD
ncbi:hypothetical protein C3941_05225 [Kaistia algarum]|uniref:site-2 protease family protein n=1 Tax=Kaistia algarum TaxID=2083279 RepID=UPI000CE88D96|nr:site-2 protease family protein [Kaistia algarum]MCX5515919.1 site-2 protease family protein [Kaistia algarum]PPE80720.1 hypothetical protein C3941_05225 [Kaistia algarum]